MARPADPTVDSARGGRRVLRGLAAMALCLACVLAGVGWLYLLRGAGALEVGRAIDGALPLERLAHHAAQPVLRMVVAWVPAGFLAGWALARLAGVGRLARGVVAAAVAFVVLWLTSGLADAVTANEQLLSHIGATLHRPGVWVATALFAVGALIPPLPWPPPRR